jgi:hypothetical protein
MYKNISAEISTENKDLVIQKLMEINDLMPFLSSLTLDEKKRLPKMGKRRFKFVQDALEYAEKYPGLVPPYVDVTEQRGDMELTGKLFEIMEIMGPLWEKITDTHMAVGAEAFAASRAFYQSVKTAGYQGVPGVKSIIRDLGVIFEKSSPSTPTPAESSRKDVKKAKS